MTRLTTLAAATLALSTTGCGSGDRAGIEMGVGVPEAVFLTITQIQVTVYDDLAVCSRIRAVGGESIDAFSLALGIPQTVELSPGPRTFEVVALEDTTPVAQGCVTRDISADENNIVAVELLELANCGALAAPIEIDLGQQVVGSTQGALANFDDGGCSNVGGPELVHALYLTQDMTFPMTIHVHNDFPGTEYDAVHHARTSCLDDGTNIACSDSGAGDDLFIDVAQPRTILIVVDSHDASSGGPFEFVAEIDTGGGN